MNISSKKVSISSSKKESIISYSTINSFQNEMDKQFIDSEDEMNSNYSEDEDEMNFDYNEV